MIELANLRVGDAESVRRFWEIFDEVLPEGIARRIQSIRSWELPVGSVRPETLEFLKETDTEEITWALKAIQDEVRQAWSRATPVDRYFGFFLAACRYIISTAAGFSRSQARPESLYIDPNWATIGMPYLEIPAELHKDFVLQCFMRAMGAVDRMKVCPNEGCAAPFFIAQKRSQKYCSDTCSAPAQREFKRKWWDEHGTEWRKMHRKQVKKASTKAGTKSYRKRR